MTTIDGAGEPSGARRGEADGRRSTDAAARLDSVAYAFEVEGDDHAWTVLHAVLREGLETGYEARLRVSTADPDLDAAAALLGRDATLRLTRGARCREVPGIVAGVTERGAHGHDGAELELALVPALALLAHAVGSGVAQDRTVPDLLRDVLAEHLAPYRRTVDLDRLDPDAYPPREQCVRYRESVLGFVRRLLEEEGIGAFFDVDDEGRERLVLFDANRQLDPVDTVDGGPVPFRPGGAGGPETIGELVPTTALGPTALTVTDLDWTDPSYLAVGERAGSGPRGRVRLRHEHGHGQALTRFDFEPGQRYRQHDGDRQAELRLEAVTRERRVLRGVSQVVGLRAGGVVEVVGHPALGVDGRYVVLEVEHRSEAAPSTARAGRTDADRYHNRFACLPVEAPYRPRRRTPKPAISGVQSAVVEGPSGEAIHTDAYGRVRVRFGWGPDGGRTSAWVRVSQAWAGRDGSGLCASLFLPRVGSEVLVAFLDGDPDRPLVVGAVYNASNLPPLALPEEATRSVWRSESLAGRGGFHELSFEDAAGAEEVFLRAERDLRELVLQDHGIHVHRDQRVNVDGAQVATVGRDRRQEIKGDDTLSVLGHQQTAVLQGRATTIHGGAQSVVVGDRTGTVFEDDRLTVTGLRQVEVGRAHRVACEDTYLHLDGATLNGSAPDAVELDCGGSHVWLHGSGTIRLEAERTIELAVGRSRIAVTPDRIVLDAPELKVTGQRAEVHGSATVAVTGAAVAIEAEQGLTLAGASVEVRGRQRVEVTADLVQVNG
ncbi:MAG: type VI secretion system Vgr family protein [Sandaracinaceae bacterium]